MTLNCCQTCGLGGDLVVASFLHVAAGPLQSCATIGIVLPVLFEPERRVYLQGVHQGPAVALRHPVDQMDHQKHTARAQKVLMGFYQQLEQTFNINKYYLLFECPSKGGVNEIFISKISSSP